MCNGQSSFFGLFLVLFILVVKAQSTVTGTSIFITFESSRDCVGEKPRCSRSQVIYSYISIYLFIYLFVF